MPGSLGIENGKFVSQTNTELQQSVNGIVWKVLDVMLLNSDLAFIHLKIENCLGAM